MESTVFSDPSIGVDPQPEAPSEFDDSLRPRTKVPFARVLDFWETERDELDSELDATKEILSRFAQAVGDAATSNEEADSFLRNLDLKLISEDHNWRAIFATIRHQKVWSAQHKQAAMARYLEYLSFRRRLLAFIIERQASLNDTGMWLMSRQWPLGDGADAAEPTPGLIQLPEGVPVTLDLSTRRMVPVWLADNRFLLVASQPSSLLTDRGLQLFFPRRRALVGRHSSADVPVPGEYVNVSRAHALVEWVSPVMVTITDLSANGTRLQTDDYTRLVKAG